MGIHEVAARGFDSAAEAYEAARPGYPPAAIDWLMDRLSMTSESVLIDLAAGTGKLTRLLAARGASPIAVEPVAGMRNELHKTAPQIPLVAATAEALPFRKASVDVLTIAEAFHWFDNPTGRSQLSRVIRPGGKLGLMWNSRDRRTAWVDAIWSIIDRAERRAPSRRHKPTRSDEAWTLPGFSSFQRSEFIHDHELTREQVLQRMASISHVAVLSDEQRFAVLGEIASILDTHPDTRESPAFTITYRVDCFVAERL